MGTIGREQDGQRPVFQLPLRGAGCILLPLYPRPAFRPIWLCTDFPYPLGV